MIIDQLACKAILCWCLSFVWRCQIVDQLNLPDSYYTRFHRRATSPNAEDLLLKSPGALMKGPASACWSSQVVCLKKQMECFLSEVPTVVFQFLKDYLCHFLVYIKVYRPIMSWNSFRSFIGVSAPRWLSFVWNIIRIILIFFSFSIICTSYNIWWWNIFSVAHHPLSLVNGSGLHEVNAAWSHVSMQHSLHEAWSHSPGSMDGGVQPRRCFIIKCYMTCKRLKKLRKLIWI